MACLIVVSKALQSQVGSQICPLIYGMGLPQYLRNFPLQVDVIDIRLSVRHAGTSSKGRCSKALGSVHMPNKTTTATCRRRCRRRPLHISSNCLFRMILEVYVLFEVKKYLAQVPSPFASPVPNKIINMTIHFLIVEAASIYIAKLLSLPCPL